MLPVASPHCIAARLDLELPVYNQNCNLFLETVALWSCENFILMGKSTAWPTKDWRWNGKLKKIVPLPSQLHNKQVIDAPLKLQRWHFQKDKYIFQMDFPLTPFPHENDSDLVLYLQKCWWLLTYAEISSCTQILCSCFPWCLWTFKSLTVRTNSRNVSFYCYWDQKNINSLMPRNIRPIIS